VKKAAVPNRSEEEAKFIVEMIERLGVATGEDAGRGVVILSRMIASLCQRVADDPERQLSQVAARFPKVLDVIVGMSIVDACGTLATAITYAAEQSNEEVVLQ
jgi:hypothetical protein